MCFYLKYFNFIEPQKTLADSHGHLIRSPMVQVRRKGHWPHPREYPRLILVLFGKIKIFYLSFMKNLFCESFNIRSHTSLFELISNIALILLDLGTVG